MVYIFVLNTSNVDILALNVLLLPSSNGYTEGCNNKIKVLKRISYGLRHFGRFRTRILLLSKKNDTEHNGVRCRKKTGWVARPQHLQKNLKKTPTALAVGVKGYTEVFTVSNIPLLPIHSRYSFPVRWAWTFPALQPAG